MTGLAPAPVSRLHRPARRPRRVLTKAQAQAAGVLLVAVSVFLISPPGALNFLRLVPVLVPLLLVHLHLLRRTGLRPGAVRVSLPLVVLLLWWGVTALWSVDVRFTAVQVLASTLAIVAGSVAGSMLTRRQLLAGIALGGGLALAASVVLALVDPAAGLEQGDYQTGALHGIYVERNVLAAVLLIPAVAAIALLISGGRLRLIVKVLLAAALVGGVVATSSSTALAAMLASAALLVLLLLVSRLPALLRRVVVPLLFAAVAAVVALAVADPEAAIAGLQRDSTLTGRVVIWQAAQVLIGQRPLVGYGRGVPWDRGSVVGDFMESSVQFPVSSAHSGYLQTLLETGAVGLVLLAVAVAVLVALCVRNLLRGEFTGAWGIALLGALLLHNYAESSILSSLTLYLLAAVLAGASRPRDEVIGRPSERSAARRPA